MKKSNKILIVIIIAFMACLCLGLFYYVIVKNPINNGSKQNSNEINADVENEVSNNEVINDEETLEDVTKVGEVYALDIENVYVNDVMLNEKDSGLFLYEYDDTNADYVEIYYAFYSYATEPGLKYVLNVMDEKGNNILLNEGEQALGVVSIAKIEKCDLNQTIQFILKETIVDTEEVTKSIETKIDLKNDLKEITKINQLFSIEEKQLEDVKFRHLPDEYEYFGSIHHSVSTELVGAYYSFIMKSQYGNDLVVTSHMGFRYYKNVNELSLNEAFDNMVLIEENAGHYGLSDVYELAINNNGEIIDTVNVSFEQMIDLCNGKTVQVDGVEYTGKTFEFEQTDNIHEIGKVKIIDEIEAIKYSYDNEEDMVHYMFEYNENIYDLELPTEERIAEEVEYILDSLEIVE